MAAAGQLLGAQSARAADLYFDGDGVGTVQANSGIWDGSSPRWGTSAASVPPFVAWTDGNNAIFNGPSGTITYSTSSLTAAGVSFQSGKYMVMSQNGGILNWGDNATVNVAPGADLQIFSSIGGSGGFTKTGQGSFGFYNNGVGGGPVNVNEGTIYYAASSANFNNSTSVNVAAGATFDFKVVNDQFGSLSGAGTVKLGFLGLGIATGSRMQVGSDNSSTTFSGSILGAGGRFDKEGTGTMTLSGSNTFNGFATVTGGTLRVENGHALGDNAPVFIGNVATAILELGGSEAIGSLGGAGDTGGMVNVNGQTLTLGGDNLANNYLGGVTGGGLIIKNGNGVQIINSATTNTAASTFTGKYVINSGILAFRADNRTGSAPASNTADYFTLTGGELSNTGFGGTTLNARKGITVMADSTISALGAINSIFVVGSSGGAPITGSNSITKRGQGILRVDSDSSATFSGNWILRDGTLNTTRGIASPLGTGGYDIQGSTLSLTPGGSSTAVVYTLAASNTNAAVAFGPGAVLNVNRGANPSFIANFGPGPLVRKPVGSLVITSAGGPVNLGSPTNGESIFFPGGVPTDAGVPTIIPGVIATTNFSPSTAASSAGDFVSYSPVSGVVRATYTSSDLTTAGPASVVEQLTNATLAGDTTVGALKLGDGNTGATVDTAGFKLTIGSGAAASTGMLILNAGSDVNGDTGKIDFRASHGIIYTQLGNNNIRPVIAGSGGLSKNGPGTLTLQTATTYTGPTAINQGSLILTGDQQLPTTTDLTINGNATLDLSSGGSQTVNSLNVENLPAVSGTGGGMIAMGSTSVLKMTGSGDMVFRGGMTSPTGVGAATVWKAGPGVLTLGLKQSISTFGGGVASPAMSYDKLWVSGGGVIEISSGNSIPDSGGALPDAFMLDNGTLRINTLNTTGVAAGGASTFTLTSSSGNVRGLKVGPGGGTIDVANPFEIVFEQTSNAESTSFDLISGTGTLTKTGPGFFRLGTGNSFTGNWIIKQGNLQFQRDKALGADTGSVVSNRLTLDGGVIESNGSGIFGPDYGVTIGANGGTIRGPFVFNSNVSGPGAITRLGSNNNLVFNAPDNTFSGIKIQQGFVYFNGNNSAGTGTIVVDPVFSVGLGKNEGPDSTINNPIQLNEGSLIDIRITSDISPVVESIYNLGQTGTLRLAGKISGPGSLFKGFAASETYTIPPAFTSSVVRPLDGTLVLSNSGNDFTGNFTISLGTVEVTTNGALGATNGATIVNNQGTLSLRNVNYAAAEPLFISGTGKGGLGALRSVGGDSTYGGPVSLMADATVGVDPGTSLNLSGGLRSASVLTKSDDGKLILSGINNNVTGDIVVAKGSLDFASNHSIGKLRLQTGTVATVTTGNHALRATDVVFNLDGNFNPDAKLDLTNGRLIVDYDPINNPGAGFFLRNAIVSAYGVGGGPHWTGNGITSSTAQNNASLAVGYAEASDLFGPNGGTWTGEAVDGSTFLARTTLAGDTNLDGQVNFTDLVALAQHYGDTSGAALWDQGDFTYDGNIDFNDLVKLAQNYGGTFPAAGVPGASVPFDQDLARAFASVPEPGALSLVALGATAALGRRRRRRSDKR